MRGDEFFTRIAQRPPFTKLHPQVAAFFKDYFAHEKVVRFGDRHVVNTHFPPFPSPAFDCLAEGFAQLGDVENRRLYSVTLAVTNRCSFRCWHCYNAGRSQADLPLSTWAALAAELQERGAVMITLTGGEPLLRDDLEEIVRRFDQRSCVIVGTTGDGLTAERARRLHEAGVFGLGVSLDSHEESEHDRLRGRAGAFRTALRALGTARQSGLYAYIVAVATREFLEPVHFQAFMQRASRAGALEVHLLEPSAVGRLSGRRDVLLTKDERASILEYQRQVAQDDSLPIVSSYAYLESPDAFGCGAGLTHMYIDGSGEVCPCQLVPMSFGNATREPLGAILDRMGCHFRQPRTACVGRLFAPHIDDSSLPTSPAVSEELCAKCLPREHALPRFFRVHQAARDEVGPEELRSAYDNVHGDYDDFWLSEAAAPIDDLVARLPWRGDERVFEAGCGTGYATALLAAHAAQVVAVDLSEGMLLEARRRLGTSAQERVQFVAGDALAALATQRGVDVVFSSWVLGYIPLKPFFAAAAGALGEAGRLAFIVHRENSPREPLEIFAELVAADPSVLQKRVAFDFPRDAAQVRAEMAVAGLTVEALSERSVVFRYGTSADVLEHLLKSGAGTAFYDAIDPARRPALTQEFLKRLDNRHPGATSFAVAHEYVACVARKPGRRDSL